MTPVEAFIEATKVRAKAYSFLYEEMVNEIGRENADKIFSNATYKLGVDKSKLYSEEARKNAKILAEEFVSNPLSHEVFKQSVIEGDENKAVIQMKRCPLVDKWKEMGLSRDKIKTLCDLAYRVDFGKIESLGYKMRFDKRLSDNDDSCMLVIEKM